MSKSTWTAWTFRLGDKAFKNIRPIEMELVQERAIVATSGMLWWKRNIEKDTGRWLIKLKFDRGPGTFARTESIFFNTESDARYWFNETYITVFAGLRQPVPPKPSKKQNKKPHLRLL